ncbi:MAG: hypothetical protein ABIG32_04060 [Candidatus Uhrbacteria bacterium]
MQKVINLLAGIAMVAAMVPVNYVGATTTDSLSADRVWHYDDYRVERLDFGSKEVDGLYSIGEHVIIATLEQGCLGECDRRDLYLVKDGAAVLVPNVPAYILDESRYYMNGERFIWIDKVDLDSNRYDIVELDPATGEKITLASDIFINGAEAVEAYASGDDYYFEVTFNFNNHNGFEQAAVYKYDPARKEGVIVTKHYDLNHEEILDVADGKLLTLMTFENGYKQMWIYGESEWPYAIPNTWTVPQEDIVGAHFVADGGIEFFRQFERYTWIPNDEAGTTEATGDLLNWYLDPADSIFIMGDQMAWINTEDQIMISDEAGVYAGPQGTLWNMDLTIALFGHDLVEVQDEAVLVTSYLNDAIVGIYNDNCIYYNGKLVVHDLGYGTNPTASDQNHVYWMGVEGNVYEATITAGLTGAKLKLTGDPKVYVVGEDGKLHWIISQAVAYAIYGNTWNQNITEINNLNLVNYSFGTSITSEADINII